MWAWETSSFVFGSPSRFAFFYFSEIDFLFVFDIFSNLNPFSSFYFYWFDYETGIIIIHSTELKLLDWWEFQLDPLRRMKSISQITISLLNSLWMKNNFQPIVVLASHPFIPLNDKQSRNYWNTNWKISSNLIWEREREWKYQLNIGRISTQKMMMMTTSESDIPTLMRNRKAKCCWINTRTTRRYSRVWTNIGFWRGWNEEEGEKEANQFEILVRQLPILLSTEKLTHSLLVFVCHILLGWKKKSSKDRKM